MKKSVVSKDEGPFRQSNIFSTTNPLIGVLIIYPEPVESFADNELPFYFKNFNYSFECSKSLLIFILSNQNLSLELTPLLPCWLLHRGFSGTKHLCLGRFKFTVIICHIGTFYDCQNFASFDTLRETQTSLI